MTLRHPDFAGKKIAVIGFGREGKATLAYLQKYHPTAEVTVHDQDEAHAKLECSTVTGVCYLDGLEKYDVIIKSPGIPLLPELEAAQSRMTSATRLFWEIIADTGSTVIGVTGTKGKSTVSSLIHHILKEGGRQSVLVGNVGEPVMAHLEEAGPETIYVQELSSYQLADVTSSPPIAVITSFFPDHLDYHVNLESYFGAKQNIVRFQKANDRVYYPAGDAEAARMAAISAGEKVAVPAETDMAQHAKALIGDHNERNVALAVAVTQYLGVDEGETREALRSFQALPHRLQVVEVKNGITWVDDAISTTPQSTIAGLDSLEGRVDTLIAGGLNRGYDFAELASRIFDSGVENVIIFPDSGPKIADALAAVAPAFPTHELRIETATDMAAAVRMADAMSKPNKICLLSPASPSYNMFKNFEDRGDQFAEAVRNLPNHPLNQ